jgi:hypothetical protein
VDVQSRKDMAASQPLKLAMAIISAKPSRDEESHYTMNITQLSTLPYSCWIRLMGFGWGASWLYGRNTFNVKESQEKLQIPKHGITYNFHRIVALGIFVTNIHT